MAAGLLEQVVAQAAVFAAVGPVGQRRAQRGHRQQQADEPQPLGGQRRRVRHDRLPVVVRMSGSLPRTPAVRNRAFLRNPARNPAAAGI